VVWVYTVRIVALGTHTIVRQQVFLPKGLVNKSSCFDAALSFAVSAVAHVAWKIQVAIGVDGLAVPFKPSLQVSGLTPSPLNLLATDFAGFDEVVGQPDLVHVRFRDYQRVGPTAEAAPDG